jgi:hypothetical protein
LDGTAAENKERLTTEETECQRKLFVSGFLCVLCVPRG